MMRHNIMTTGRPASVPFLDTSQSAKSLNVNGSGDTSDHERQLEYWAPPYPEAPRDAPMSCAEPAYRRGSFSDPHAVVV